jgi:hypothetical protein
LRRFSDENPTISHTASKGIYPSVEIQNGKMNKNSDWLFFAIAIIAGFALMRWFFG